MGGKQSTAARSRGPFPGVSTDDSAVPPPGGAPHFGHYRTGGGAMGLRSRSVSSVAGMGMDPSTAGGVPFGLYTPASRGTGDSERAPGGGGSASDSTYAHGNGYQETGGGHHRDGMLYLGSRASLADALPLHIAPRWFSSHSDESSCAALVPSHLKQTMGSSRTSVSSVTHCCKKQNLFLLWSL
ncbi:E3 ubiquitin-protein ligase ZNRF1 isoform X2 [Homo sapiens]|uniref:E3 ubiquitin-protein ligase ZNRF1 isoform X2 n=1 Tax=Homo sapiens TaxID=9606 RepID=UPI0005D018D1|nr:E3 ubiquitin-protein ligase ZNRF1 isoform X2 [Homo sapiens]|eukprot:XP_016879283.1 E3 ubiquitin-protein ligase ZNRF1 isoform X2 [Homo sapiens]